MITMTLTIHIESDPINHVNDALGTLHAVTMALEDLRGEPLPAEHQITDIHGRVWGSWQVTDHMADIIRANAEDGEQPPAIATDAVQPEIDSDEDDTLLNIARTAQHHFWESLRDLEEALGGIEIDGNGDLDMETIESLMANPAPDEDEAPQIL